MPSPLSHSRSMRSYVIGGFMISSFNTQPELKTTRLALTMRILLQHHKWSIPYWAMRYCLPKVVSTLHCFETLVVERFETWKVAKRRSTGTFVTKQTALSRLSH